MSDTPVTPADLWPLLETVTLRERQRFARRLRGLKKVTEPAAQQAVLHTLQTEICAAAQQLASLRASVPAITYPEALPVSQKRAAIQAALRDHQVIIVAGETGSGKTTQLPKMCLEMGRGLLGRIAHTQPRRLAARAVARRIADELNTPLGEQVGYKVRFSDQTEEKTLIKLMTDGILLTEIQHDRLLWQYDTLIIDEAHERSLNIDFLLGYLAQILPERPDLKVIITSATIDPERFSRHFNQAPIIEVSGRTWPVEVRYRPLVDEETGEARDPMQAMVEAVEELHREGPGDILIFMSGEREIRDTADALHKQNWPQTEILPLYARLATAEQQRIFAPHAGRRIILATNIAETSLTVPGIKYVIDTGTARISRYSARTKVQRLPIEPISQASADQRKGRCGRVSAGVCIRLYSEADFLSRPLFTDPEILRTSLAAVILQMLALGLGDIHAFPFIQPPEKRHIQDGYRLLEELGAIQPDRRNGPGRYKLTALGRQLAQLPVDPRLGRMLLEAARCGAVQEVLILTAALSIQDPRERPADQQQAAAEKHNRFSDKTSDFISLLNLWRWLDEQQKTLSASQFRRRCKSDFLNYLRVREWQDLYSQLRQACKTLHLPLNTEPAGYREIHCALLSGLLSHIGQKSVEKGDYLGARNTRFALFPGSALFKHPPKWVMVAELVETTKLWGRMAARIEPEWIEPLAPHLVRRSYSEPHWERRQGAVMASETVTLFGLPIVAARRVNYGSIDPVLSRELFIRHALVDGDWQTRHAFFQHNARLRASLETLEHKSRRRDILVDDETLFHFYQQRIPDEVVSARHFDAWWTREQRVNPTLLNFDKAQLLNDTAEPVRASDYPDYWQQGKLRLRLTYQFEPGAAADGVTVHIPLAVLNQVENRGFDWQIPGLRHQLVVALIKSLPKPLRRHFVPAPNYATAFLERVTPDDQPLTDALERELRRMTGVTVPSDAWQWQNVPDHLRITFRVSDKSQNVREESKDLAALQNRLRGQVQQTLAEIADDGLERKGLQQWDFGALPQTYTQRRQGYTVKAWPALVDEKTSVAIALLDNPHEQQIRMWQGIRRLLWLNIPSPIKYLHEKLPNKSKLGLYFNPYGNVLRLIDDCIACAIDKIMADNGGLVWDAEQCNALYEKVRANLNEVVVAIAAQVEVILTQAFAINKRLKGRIDLTLAMAMADIQSQLSSLIYPGFVTDTGWAQLSQLPRYLSAIERRLEKLAIDPHRDRALLLKVAQIQQEWQQWRDNLALPLRHTASVRHIRWMIEELRVSYFAQHLGTPYPISEKRIRQAMAQVVEGEREA